MKLRISRSRRKVWTGTTAGIAIVGLLLGLTTAVMPHASAITQGTGSGGGSGGGGGGISTDNGFGWFYYQFGSPSNPAQPASYHNDNYATISSSCSAEGGAYIFVVFNGSKTVGSGRAIPVGAIYSNKSNRGYINNKDRGTTAEDTVHGHYDTLGGGQYPARTDFSILNWGDGSRTRNTVEWFCWSNTPPNPPWSVTTSTSVDRAYAEPGELITWTHKVTNGGPNNTNKDVTFKYNNAGSLPAGSGGNWTLPSGTSSGNGATPQISTYVVQKADFGKQVCRTTSASPSTNTGGTYTDSPPTCVTIGKKPKVQVHGNDLILGRPFIGGAQQLSSANTSISQLNAIPSGASGNIFGSWVEYGIFATKNVTGLGSGSAFAGGANASDVCSYSLLTFVNATTSNPATACSGSTTAGGYATGRTIPDVQSDFSVVSGTPVYDDTAAAPQGLYTSDASADPITVAASGVKTIKKGEWVVINAPNADVTIANDITYDTSPLQSIYDIPQLVIIAKDIYISPTVKQVDAWLVAQGSTTAGTGLLDTCHISSDYTTQLSTTICNNVLQVNGPVMAQKLWLRRTGGATTADPAEVFNLRPDAYMWGYARASTSGRVQTVYSQELPPRF